MPSTVGKITPDGTPEEDVVVRREHETDLRHPTSRGRQCHRATEPLRTTLTARTALSLAAQSRRFGLCLYFFHMNMKGVGLARDESASDRDSGPPPSSNTGKHGLGMGALYCRRSSARCGRSILRRAHSRVRAPIDLTPASIPSHRKPPPRHPPGGLPFIIDQAAAAVGASTAMSSQKAATILPLTMTPSSRPRDYHPHVDAYGWRSRYPPRTPRGRLRRVASFARPSCGSRSPMGGRLWSRRRPLGVRHCAALVACIRDDCTAAGRPGRTSNHAALEEIHAQGALRSVTANLSGARQARAAVAAMSASQARGICSASRSARRSSICGAERAGPTCRYMPVAGGPIPLGLGRS